MANRYYKGPVTDHFDGTRFYHPGLPPSDKGFLDILKWQLSANRAKWPQRTLANSGLRPPASVEGCSITAIGHASLLIQVAELNILIDPVWADRASPFMRLGPERRNPPAVALNDLPPIHAVLVTHNHYDHMDVATIRKLWDAHRPTVISPLGNDAVIHTLAPNVEVKTGDWWDTFVLSDGVRATIVPSYHWSARWFGDRRMALWGGFVLETPSGVIYCAGDTAYRDGKIFAEIGERFGAPLVAVLPIGAYAPRWFMQSQHADPYEAVQIALDCGAHNILGVHWNTFQLTDEPHEEPAHFLEDAIRRHGSSNPKALPMRAGDVWSAQEGR